MIYVCYKICMRHEIYLWENSDVASYDNDTKKEYALQVN